MYQRVTNTLLENLFFVRFCSSSKENAIKNRIYRMFMTLDFNARITMPHTLVSETYELM